MSEARNGNEARARTFPKKTFQFIEESEEWKGREGREQGEREREREPQGRIPTA